MWAAMLLLPWMSADIVGLAQEEAQMQEALLRLRATIEAKRQQLGQLGV